MKWLLALLIGNAFAADAHRVDFTQALIDQDGVVMVECVDPVGAPMSDCKSRREVTLGSVAMRSLASPEQGITAEDSLRRGQLALSVYKSTGADLTVEEIALIKKQVAKTFGPLVVARVFPLLDPAVK